MLSNVFWVTLDGLTEGSELTVTVDTWGEDRGVAWKNVIG